MSRFDELVLVVTQRSTYYRTYLDRTCIPYIGHIYGASSERLASYALKMQWDTFRYWQRLYVEMYKGWFNVPQCLRNVASQLQTKLWAWMRP